VGGSSLSVDLDRDDLSSAMSTFIFILYVFLSPSLIEGRYHCLAVFPNLLALSGGLAGCGVGPIWLIHWSHGFSWRQEGDE
jgi:hypothetical protein